MSIHIQLDRIIGIV